MNAYHIEATEFTPKVSLNHEQNVFEFIGESRPEDANEFYFPILDWLDEYQELKGWKNSSADENSPIEIKFYFEYFNSTSAKFIMDILKKVYEFRADGMPVVVKWCYDEMDTDMQETGEEMEELIGVPFVYEAIT